MNSDGFAYMFNLHTAGAAFGKDKPDGRCFNPIREFSNGVIRYFLFSSQSHIANTRVTMNAGTLAHIGNSKVFAVIFT